LRVKALSTVIVSVAIAVTVAIAIAIAIATTLKVLYLGACYTLLPQFVQEDGH